MPRKLLSARQQIALQLFKDWKLPIPKLEFTFSEERKFRFDFAWPDYRLYLELQGGTWRGGGGAHRGSGAIRDMEKFSEASILGWRGLYCTPDQFFGGNFADTLRRALHEPSV